MIASIYNGRSCNEKAVLSASFRRSSIARRVWRSGAYSVRMPDGSYDDLLTLAFGEGVTLEELSGGTVREP